MQKVEREIITHRERSRHEHGRAANLENNESQLLETTDDLVTGSDYETCCLATRATH